MLLELRKQIQEKHKIENKIKNIEVEIAKKQREISILNMQFDENVTNLNKLERNIFIFNKENKIIELEDKIRNIKSKLKTYKYQLNLDEIELNRLNQSLTMIQDCEIKYQEELNHQINKQDIQLKIDYLQTKNENENYSLLIDESEKIIDCLKKMDLFYNRGDNYHPNDKLYTLGNTTWIMGSPRVDICNLKKEIYRFEDLLIYLKEKDEFIDDLEKYYINSNQFFSKSSIPTFYKSFDYSMSVIDLKRDISNILSKLKFLYKENMKKENELYKLIEEEIIKK